MKTLEERAVDELLSTLRPIWRKRGKNVAFRFSINRNQYIEGNMANLTTEQMFKDVSVAPKTAAGNPAPIDGDVTMVSSDPSVVAVEVLGSNLFNLVSGNIGVAQIDATFDADMDVGEVRTITATLAIAVVAAEAETAELVVGAPVLKDTAIVSGTGSVTP